MKPKRMKQRPKALNRREAFIVAVHAAIQEVGQQMDELVELQRAYLHVMGEALEGNDKHLIQLLDGLDVNETDRIAEGSPKAAAFMNELASRFPQEVH